MELELLPFIIGVLAAIIVVCGVYAQRQPYESGYGTEIFSAAVTLFVVAAIVKAIIFLTMAEIILSVVTGMTGGFVLGLGFALHSWAENESPADCWSMCTFPTILFGLVGFVGGALFIA